jgi:hypothetical protein
VNISAAAVAVTISQPTAPLQLQAGATTNLIANVSNDPNKLGVTWSITCKSATCGSLIPASALTASGQLISYVAPSSVPSGGTVTITATANADATKQASVAITITPMTLRNDLLNGNYAFLLTGVNTGGNSALAGSMYADGAGNITSAEEALPGKEALQTGISGTYFVGSDGRGTITLSGLPSSLWNNGQQIFKVAVVDPTHARIEEFDGTGGYDYTPTGFVTSVLGSTLSGTLDLQTLSAVPPSGAYAFAWSAGSSATAGYYGGVLTADATGAITSFTMDRYIGDKTDSISSTAYSPTTFSSADASGAGTVKIGPYNLNYFMVTSEHLILLASTASSGLPAGHMYAQAATPASIAGNYVFTLAGSTPTYSSNSSTVSGSLPQTAGGWFACDSSGNLSGYLDTNNNGTVEMAPVSGTCAIGSDGRGTLSMTGGGASAFALYPTANQGVLMFQLDSRRSGIGTAMTQSASAGTATTLQGTYAASAQQMGSVNSLVSVSNGTPAGSWSDIVGQVTSDGISSLSGTVDADQVNGQFIGYSGNFWTQTSGTPLTGNFSAGAQGRFTGSLTTAPTGAMTEIFYVVNDSTIVYQEADSIPAVGILQVQNF